MESMNGVLSASSFVSVNGEALAAIFAGMTVFSLIMSAVSIAMYVLQSLGLYTIAKRRGIHKPWLAWIPVGNVWTIGCISDQYQYVSKGKSTNRRKVLLALSIVAVVGAIAILGNAFSMLGWVLSNMDALEYMSDAQILNEMLGRILSVAGIGLIIGIIAIVMAVFEYIALYDLYRSSSPENATLYLLLSIFVSVTMPFFVFSCRNKDGGMPPRQDAPQPIQNCQNTQDRDEPWT